jgi:hypothetical protein
MTKDEIKDRIARAEEIQRYTENRCVAIEKENEKLKKQLEMSNKVYNDNLDYSHHIEGQLTKAKELLERLLITSCNSDVLNLLPNCSEVLRVRVEAEQFLKEADK